MKNMKSIFFNHEQYKEKIYNITNLRILSFEIYKVFLFLIFMFIISKLSYYFPFSIFLEIEFNLFKLGKIFIYLLIIDISYFYLFKSNIGEITIMEIIINSIIKPNLIKILSVSISFCLIYLTTIEMKLLMPRLNEEYIKKRYNIEPKYRDEYEENYYERNGLMKKTIYENSDRLFNICTSIILLVNFILIKQHFDLWPKLELSRIVNFKNKLKISFRNIGKIWIPAFFIIYFIFIFYYHSIFIFNLSFNYASLFIIEYNLFFISIECLKNFICAKINYITYELYSKEQLIKKQIDFQNEENFYIIHYLKNLNGIYKYTHDFKVNTILLKFENIECIKSKIYYFIGSINRKYSMFLGKRKNFNISNEMNAVDRFKIMLSTVLDFFDYSANKVFEEQTCTQIIKYIIEIIGNITIFIADAKIDKSNEDKNLEYSDYIYFFIERLFEIDGILINLIQNRKISEPMRINLLQLRIIIDYYFDMIRDRQNKFHFIQLETQKIQSLLYGNKKPNNNYLKL